MKKNTICYLYLYIFLLYLTIPSTLQQNSVTDNLIHHYPFDGNLENILDPTLTATPSSTTNVGIVNDRKSQAQRALTLSDPGTIQYIEIPPSTLNNLNSFTLTMWVKQNPGTNRYHTFLSVANSVIDNELLIYKVQLLFKHNHLNDNSSTNTVFSNIYSDTTTWHQIAIVRDHVNGRVDHYLDGNLHASLTGTSTDPFNAEGVVIGNDQDSVLGDWDVNSQLNSCFMDFRIYDTAKTASQIQDIYNFLWCRELETPNSDQSQCVCQNHYFRNSVNQQCEECPERYGSCTDYSTPETCQGTNRKPLGDDCICKDNFYEDPDSINCIPVVDPVTDSLIHYYPFDGRMDNIIDASKPANAGTGATINNASDRFNQANRAYSIDDSVLQVLEIPPSTMNGLNSFTVTMWVKSNTNLGYQGYFSIANSSEENELLIIRSQFFFKADNSGPFDSTNQQDFSENINTGLSWKHLSIVRDQPYGRLYIYLDGVLTATMTGTPITPLNAEGIVIGNDQDSVLGGYQANAQIDGSFSDLRIYNVAKTQSDIQQIQNYIRCYPGEYPVAGTGCNICPERYATCLDASTAGTCKGLNRKDESSECACLDHYYEDPLTDGCLECPERYGNCTDDTTPDTCQGTGRKPLGDDCVCQDRHFEDPGSINCIECHERYGDCTDNSNPTSCQGTGRKLLGDDCVCLDRHFEDPGSINCIECHERYGDCTDNSNPTSCQGTGRKTLGDDCICLDRHFEDPLSINCIECHERYGDCTDNSSPISCQGTGRKPLGNDCICLDRHYEDPLSINCLQCHERYGECTAVSTPTSCQGTNRKAKEQDCLCLDHYYEDPLTINCLECPERYGNCSDDSTPITCQGTGRKDTSQDCECLDRYYQDSSSLNCLKCPERYGSCSDSTTPTSCQGDNRKSKENDCICLEGYYEYPLSKNCVQCPSNFETCTDENTPLSCQGKNRKGISDNCTCIDRFFDNPINSDCLSCQYPCECTPNPQKCGTCLSHPDECVISCHESCAQCNSEGKCVSCKLGQYLNNGVCEDCNSKCEICSPNNKDECLVCKNQNDPGRSLKISKQCDCIDGYFENPSTLNCDKCQNEQCRYCNQTGICEVCFDENLIPPLCELNKKGNFYITDSTGDKIPRKCDNKCETCESSSDNCLSCSQSLYRKSDLPCLCLDGYHDNKGQNKNCQKCPQYCSKCESSEKCLQCEDGRELNIFSGKCQCRSGHKENEHQECVKCQHFNGKCLQICPQNTIFIEEKQICEKIQDLKIINNISQIWICAGAILIMLIVSMFSFLFSFKSKEEITDQSKNNQINQNSLFGKENNSGY